MNDFEQQTLFAGLETSVSLPPLAERMRPRTLDEFVGQERLLGPGRLLRRAIEADRLQSSIFWGPPGCGKTTLASIIARMTGSAFEKLNAVTSGVADVRQVLKEAQERRLRYGRATYLLLDECHRWSKAQSDSILPAIESGLIRFIGSTTENPMVSMTPRHREPVPGVPVRAAWGGGRASCAAKRPARPGARLRCKRRARGGRRARLHRPHVGRRRAHGPGRAGAGLADHRRGDRPPRPAAPSSA